MALFMHAGHITSFVADEFKRIYFSRFLQVTYDVAATTMFICFLLVVRCWCEYLCVWASVYTVYYKHQLKRRQRIWHRPWMMWDSFQMRDDKAFVFSCVCVYGRKGKKEHIFVLKWNKYAGVASPAQTHTVAGGEREREYHFMKYVRS